VSSTGSVKGLLLFECSDSTSSKDIEAVEEVSPLQIPSIGTLFPFDESIFAPVPSLGQLKYKLSDLVKCSNPLDIYEPSTKLGRG